MVVAVVEAMALQDRRVTMEVLAAVAHKDWQQEQVTLRQLAPLKEITEAWEPELDLLGLVVVAVARLVLEELDLVRMEAMAEQARQTALLDHQ